MAQEIIDVGATANDGTGESLRTAFEAVNNNFSQIWSSGPVDSNVVISGNTITVTGTNNNLVLRANGIGNIQANSTIMPSIDGVYDLGAEDTQFNSVYGQYFYGNGAGLTGITANVGNYITQNQTNVVAHSSYVNVGVQGTANVLLINTSNTTIKGSFLPATSGTYNLGSSGQRWNLIFSSDLSASGQVSAVGNITSDSNISATYFLGNGSQLTGLPATYGNSNVADFLANYGANTLSTTGNITGSYHFGNGYYLTGIQAGTNYSNANVAAYLPTYTGDLYPGNITATGNVQGANLVVGSGNIYIGNVAFSRTLTVGTRTTPVTVPMASNNSFNVLARTGNVVVYAT